MSKFPWQKAAAVAGVAGFALLILPSLLGGKKDGEGSESGGFQLPSIFPAGSGAGEAAPTGGNTYNISFPDFPGFPSDSGSFTKKESSVSGYVPSQTYTSPALQEAVSRAASSYSPTKGYDPKLAMATSAAALNTMKFEETKKQAAASYSPTKGYDPKLAMATSAAAMKVMPSSSGKSTGGMGKTFYNKSYSNPSRTKKMSSTGAKK